MPSLCYNLFVRIKSLGPTQSKGGDAQGVNIKGQGLLEIMSEVPDLLKTWSQSMIYSKQFYKINAIVILCISLVWELKLREVK